MIILFLFKAYSLKITNINKEIYSLIICKMQVENHKLQDSKVKDNSKTQKLKIKKLKIPNLQFRTKV